MVISPPNKDGKVFATSSLPARRRVHDGRPVRRDPGEAGGVQEGLTRQTWDRAPGPLRQVVRNDWRIGGGPVIGRRHRASGEGLSALLADRSSDLVDCEVGRRPGRHRPSRRKTGRDRSRMLRSNPRSATHWNDGTSASMLSETWFPRRRLAALRL